jgi:hypothetical protein
MHTSLHSSSASIDNTPPTPHAVMTAARSDPHAAHPPAPAPAASRAQNDPWRHGGIRTHQRQGVPNRNYQPPHFRPATQNASSAYYPTPRRSNIKEAPAGTMRFQGETYLARPLYGALRNRVMNALYTGIREVKQAITTLDFPGRWSAAARNALQHLVPGGLQGARERAEIKSQLTATLRGMERTVQKGANNIGLIPSLWGGGHAHIGTDNIHFTESNIFYPPAQFLAKSMIHEHAHLYAANAGYDYWYVDGNLNPRPNAYGRLTPFTFNNAKSNAETLAKVTETLSVGPRRD